jgi:hypothetical protein
VYFTKCFTIIFKSAGPVSRLRMGYTNMTHSYRLEGNLPPYCEKCSTTATIDHILWNCSVLNAARDNNDVNSDIMKNEVDAAIRLVRFLKVIGVSEHI